jgi:hypothetical protein
VASLPAGVGVVVAVVVRRHFFAGTGQGSHLCTKFRATLWIEASCRLRAAEPPRPLSPFPAGKPEFRSQIGSNQAAFPRWLGQNR